MSKGKRQKIDKGIYRENNSYYAYLYVQGKRVGPKKCQTLGFARRWLNQKRVEKDENENMPTSVRAGQITFDPLVKDRLEIIKGLASFEGELGRIRWWKKRFKNCLVRSITYQDINKALVDIVDSGRKPSTRNLYFSTLRTIFTLAIKNNKVEKSPCLGIKKLKENNKLIRWLDIGEERKLMAVMPEDFQLVMTIALNTGLRVAEQMKLKWNDVDFRSRQITIIQTKAGETQYQPMNDIAFKAFRRLREMPSHISGDVFYWINQFKGNEKTPNYNKLRYRWGKYCKKAGVKKCRWHHLRHTYASRMVIENVSLVVVQSLMRHADVKTTMMYVHLAPKNQEEALAKLENWYNKPDNWQEIGIQQLPQQPSVSTVNY